MGVCAVSLEGVPRFLTALRESGLVLEAVSCMINCRFITALIFAAVGLACEQGASVLRDVFRVAQ